MMQILLEQRQTSNPKCYWNHIPNLLICFYISVYDFKTNHSPVYAHWAVSTEMKIVMSSIEIFIPDMSSSCVFSWTNHHNKDHSREEKKKKQKSTAAHCRHWAFQELCFWYQFALFHMCICLKQQCLKLRLEHYNQINTRLTSHKQRIRNSLINKFNVFVF